MFCADLCLHVAIVPRAAVVAIQRAWRLYIYKLMVATMTAPMFGRAATTIARVFKGYCCMPCTCQLGWVAGRGNGDGDGDGEWGVEFRMGDGG